MVMVNLKTFVEKIKESELEGNLEYGYEYFDNDILEFWNEENFEDRNIVLEDLKCNEGFLYNKMVEWHFILEKYELGFDAWEYSLEDYFRDAFNEEEGFIGRLFSIEDINKMMYGADYDLNIVGKY
jgi:hypothetical protein